MINLVKGMYGGFASLARVLEPLGLLGLRLSMANVFLPSGMKKAQDFDGAVALFQYEFFEDLPSNVNQILAGVTMVAEIVLPIMLVIGFMGRVAALGLLIMTGVIFTFVFPEAFKIEYWWSAILFALVTRGCGAWSLDRLIGLEK